MSGRTIVIGAPGDNLSGSAYAYTRCGTDGVAESKLFPLDGRDGDFFGSSVAVDGETAVVAAFGKQAVYIFSLQNDGSWSQQNKLTGEDAGFGRSLAMKGNIIVVGALPAGIPGAAGKAYIYERNENGSWSRSTKITSSDEGFGVSVATDGTRVIVGARFGHDDRSGSAQVFHKNAGSWLREAKLKAVDGFEAALFGETVAIDGDTVMVASDSALNDGCGCTTGAVYHYEHDGSGSWDYQEKLFSNDIQGGDGFGSSIAVDGDMMAIGTRRGRESRGGDFQSGVAYLFKKVGGSWSQQEKVEASSATDEDASSYGYEVAIDGDAFLVSSEADDDYRGAVYIYLRS